MRSQRLATRLVLACQTREDQVLPAIYLSASRSRLTDVLGSQEICRLIHPPAIHHESSAACP